MKEARPARAAALATDILQALLLVCIVGWVLDLPRRLLGVSLYTEQLLATCLGLGLALSFIARRDRPPHWLEWAAAAVSLAICGYITVRYEPLSYELANLPTEGVVGSAILIFVVMLATARTAGATLVGIILVLAAWVFVGPHFPADFRTLPVSPQRLLVYLGLDEAGERIAQRPGAVEGGEVDADRRHEAAEHRWARREESRNAARERGPGGEGGRRQLLQAPPELAQAIESRPGPVRRDDRAVDRADRCADHPVGLEARLVHGLVDAAVVRAERAAALHHQDDLAVRHGYSAVQPPSMESSAPVIEAAAPLQR